MLRFSGALSQRRRRASVVEWAQSQYSQSFMKQILTTVSDDIFVFLEVSAAADVAEAAVAAG